MTTPAHAPATPRVVVADITTLDVAVIVNAANEMLEPGGGVCGAIHAAAGPGLARACEAIGGCPTGDARLTPGFELPAPWVVHTVGPVYHDGRSGERALLASCYRRSLELAGEREAASIAFPCISTGIFGYPAEEAAAVALETMATWLREDRAPREIICCCFAARDADVYRRLLAARPG